MKLCKNAITEVSTSTALDAAHAATATADTTGGPNRPQDVCLYRLPQVLARIPVSKSTWFAGIQAGRFPRGRSLGPRTTVWRSDEIDQLVFATSRQRGQA